MSSPNDDDQGKQQKTIPREPSVIRTYSQLQLQMQGYARWHFTSRHITAQHGMPWHMVVSRLQLTCTFHKQTGPPNRDILILASTVATERGNEQR